MSWEASRPCYNCGTAEGVSPYRVTRNILIRLLTRYRLLAQKLNGNKRLQHGTYRLQRRQDVGDHVDPGAPSSSDVLYLCNYSKSA